MQTMLRVVLAIGLFTSLHAAQTDRPKAAVTEAVMAAPKSACLFNKL
jgi:hypothetical protein